MRKWFRPSVASLLKKRDLAALIETLSAFDPEQRLQAQQGLTQLSGTDVTESLIQAVDQGKHLAARVLALRGDRQAIPALCRALENPEVSVHQESRTALVSLRAVDELRLVFQNSRSTFARTVAFRALRELNPEDFEELARLALEDPEQEIRSLVEFQAVKPRLLDSPDEGLRLSAVRALSTRGLAEEIDELFKALDDSCEQIRAIALEGLAFTWEQSEWREADKALQLLLPKLQDESRNVRTAACSALGRMKLGLADLRACLQDSDDMVRVSATLALARHRDRDSVEALIPLVEQGSWAAARALGEIGDPRALTVLRQALGRRSLSAIAAEALGELGDPAAIPALEKFVSAGAQAPPQAGDSDPIWFAEKALRRLRRSVTPRTEGVK